MVERCSTLLEDKLMEPDTRAGSFSVDQIGIKHIQTLYSWIKAAILYTPGNTGSLLSDTYFSVDMHSSGQ